MKDIIPSTLTLWATWTSIIVSGIWAWLVYLHKFTKTWNFKLSIFMIKIFMWWFIWYIVQQYTDSWALAWIAWVFSTMIFDFIEENWPEIVKKFAKDKFNLEIK